MPYPKQDLPAETSSPVAASAVGPGVAAVKYNRDGLHTTGIEVEKISSCNFFSAQDTLFAISTLLYSPAFCC